MVDAAESSRGSLVDVAISEAVRDIGNVGGNTDGIVTDADGTLYITDATHGGIVKYDPGSKTMAIVASTREYIGPIHQR